MSTYPGTGASPLGIAFDGTNMWTANAGANSVTKVSPAGAMTTYSGTGANPIGIAFDGTNMWVTNYSSSSVTKVSPAGAMTTYSGTGANPYGIAFDGTNMWTANAGANSATKVVAIPPTAPGAPTIGTATAGNATATVPFTAPGSNGGSPITGYTVVSNPAGGTDANAGTTGLSHSITGLTNGTSYTFTVTATNAYGTGSASAASNAVIPATVPGVPTIGQALPGSGSAFVQFVCSGTNGGSAITSYTAVSTPGSFTGSGRGVRLSPVSQTVRRTRLPSMRRTPRATVPLLASNAVIPVPTCPSVISGATQVSCVFPGTTDGVDGGVMTIGSGATLTVNAGQTIVASSTSIASGGSIVFVGGGSQLLTNPNYLWMVDNDHDGWPATLR